MKAMLRGFSGGKQGIKSVNTKMQSSLFYLHNRKLRRFNLKNENRKIWLEVILNTVYATVEIFTARNCDVKLVKVYILHFA